MTYKMGGGLIDVIKGQPPLTAPIVNEYLYSGFLVSNLSSYFFFNRNHAYVLYNTGGCPSSVRSVPNFTSNLLCLYLLK